MKTENEKGIAILLSIGFLALISILAMLFIVTSMTNRRISSNYNDLTTARLLAHSAVNRTIASMKLYSGDFTKNFSYVTSNSKTYAQSSIELEKI